MQKLRRFPSAPLFPLLPLYQQQEPSFPSSFLPSAKLWARATKQQLCYSGGEEREKWGEMGWMLLVGMEGTMYTVYDMLSVPFVCKNTAPSRQEKKCRKIRSSKTILSSAIPRPSAMNSILFADCHPSIAGCNVCPLLSFLSPLSPPT